jgi:hypothetical protein
METAKPINLFKTAWPKLDMPVSVLSDNRWMYGFVAQIV